MTSRLSNRHAGLLRESGHGDRAFTLIELLVVITITAVLASILLPTLKNARDLTTRLNCASRLRSLNMISIAYSNDYKGGYPYTYTCYRSTTDFAHPNRMAYSNSSINALLDYSSGSYQGWYCPTIMGTVMDYKSNLQVSVPGQPITNLIWGYTKYAATVDTSFTVIGDGGKPRYFNSSGAMVTDPEQGVATYTGYLSVQQTENAPRYQTHQGDLGVWSTPTMGRIQVASTPAPQPPSQICLWGDSWWGNGVGYDAMSHWTERVAGNSYWSDPITTQGRNEAMADGHVTWYSTATQMDIMYRTWTGQFYSMFVQDDK